MIRNIVFDMGMVMLIWDPYLPCLRHAKDPDLALRLRKEVFEHPDWASVIDGGSMPEHDYFMQVAQRQQSQQMRDLVTALAEDWWMDSLYPKHGMRPVVEGLLQQGYRLYILSNCGLRFHDFSYRIPCFDRFEGALVSAEEHMLKPHADIYHRFFDKFGLKAEECLFVDDLPANIEGARSAGMQGYCFADGDIAKLQAFLDGLNK